MIFLFGNTHEYQTNIEIQDWLDYLEYDYYKLCAEDLLELNSPKINEKDVLWLWKSTSKLNIEDYLGVKHSSINKYLSQEISTFYTYLMTLGIQYPKYEKSIVNKLSVLDKVRNIGLKTPNQLITRCKKELQRFVDSEKKVITKPLGEVSAFNIDDEDYVLYTELVNKDIIEKLPDQFFPSLFQTYIEKAFEIRSFYLDGAFFSSAIFSGNNNQTRIDFRRYDKKLPNRTVPYNLPENIEGKLKQLMSDLDLSIGAIDLIKGKDGEFYFLEINPDGHFGMISKPCNYYLEKEVAVHLQNKQYEKISR